MNRFNRISIRIKSNEKVFNFTRSVIWAFFFVTIITHGGNSYIYSLSSSPICSIHFAHISWQFPPRATCFLYAFISLPVHFSFSLQASHLAHSTQHFKTSRLHSNHVDPISLPFAETGQDSIEQMVPDHTAEGKGQNHEGSKYFDSCQKGKNVQRVGI